MPNTPYLDASVRWRIRTGRLDLEEPGYEDGIEAMARAGVVHTDLSAFNILFHDGHVWFIDFSEALRVDRTGGAPWIRLTEAGAMLGHGFTALQKYFRKYGLTIDAAPIVDR